MGIFEKALLNKTFEEWIKNLTEEVEGSVKRTASAYDDFILNYSNYPDDLITSEQKSEADSFGDDVSLKSKKHYYLMTRFNDKLFYIVKFYAHTKVDAEFADEKIIGNDNIDEVAEALAEHLCIIPSRFIGSAKETGVKFAAEVKAAMKKYLIKVLAAAQDKECNIADKFGPIPAWEISHPWESK